MEPRTSLAGVGETALGVALVRAEETGRADRLFEDPYADAFVAAAPELFAEGPAAPDELALLGALFTCLAFHGVIRTKFFDDHLLAATAAGGHQVVLLAAGLDTRAFRLPWPPGVQVFEVDLPDVLSFKDRVLAEQDATPRCKRSIVPADLRQDWAARLLEAGFEPTKRSAWLSEGLLLYLAANEAARMFDAVTDLASTGSELAFDDGNLVDSSLLAQARAIRSMDQFTSLWRGALDEDAPDWLARHGWKTQTHDHAKLAATYGRSIPAHASGDLVTAVRSNGP
jgi:methyltransferase (TIGR00027 family)